MQVFPSKLSIQFFYLLFFINVKHIKFQYESLKLSYSLAYLFQSWQRILLICDIFARNVKNVLLCIFHMTVLCVIFFAVFKQMTRAALQQVFQSVE